MPRQLGELSVQRLRGVDYPEGDGCATYVVACALYAYALHGVVGVAQAGGVEETEQCSPDLAGVLYDVAGGAGDVADYRLVIVQQTVQQRGLSGVRRTCYGHRHTFLEHPSGRI